MLDRISSKLAAATLMLVCSMATSAEQLVRAPGWLAILPDDAPPANQQVRAKGQQWFVDSNKGDDAGVGSKQQPWKTLGKLKRAGLSSGDVVWLRCGSVWRESLDMDGRAFPQDITIAAEVGCGSGQVPSIRGSDVVNSNWSSDPTLSGVSMVDRFGAVEGLLYKGQRGMLARFPDGAAPGREFALADGINKARGFRLREKERRIVGDRDLTGATVYVRVYPWQVEKATVRNYDASSGVVTLDKDLSSQILNGAGYIFEGKKWMLSAPGEWWHDTQSKRLFLFTFDGQRPQSGDVEVVVRDHAVRINNASQLRLAGVDLRHTIRTALDVTDVSDAALDGLDIADPGEYGVVIYRSKRVVFRGGRVERSGWHAVLTREAPGSVVTGNVILEHGLAGRAGGSGAAIAVRGERTVVSGNLVNRAANSGIHFFNLQGTQIVGNTVIQSCLRLTDCGGIQTWTGDSPALATRRLLVRSIVKDNVILGGSGNLEGAAGRGRFQSNGIYLDSMTGGVEVSNNRIAGTENGFYMHNAQFNTIAGNTVRSVTHASVATHMSVPGGDTIRGNRFRGNRLFSKPSFAGRDEVYAFKWQQPGAAGRLFAGDDANEIKDNQVLRIGAEGETRWYVGETNTARVISESDWRGFAKSEREQVVALKNPRAAKRFAKEGTNLLPDGDFRSGTSSWQTYFNPAGRGGSVAALRCGDSACLKLITGHAADSVSSKPFRLESEPGRNEHVLRFTIQMGSKEGAVRVSVRRDGPPYDHFGLDHPPMRLNPGQELRVELPFQATSSDAARLFIGVDPGVEVRLSRASVTRLETPPPSSLTAAGALFIVNLTDKRQAVKCSDTRLTECSSLDEQGKDIAWPLRVNAGEGVTIFPLEQGN